MTAAKLSIVLFHYVYTSMAFKTDERESHQGAWQLSKENRT